MKAVCMHVCICTYKYKQHENNIWEVSGQQQGDKEDNGAGEYDKSTMVFTYEQIIMKPSTVYAN